MRLIKNTVLIFIVLIISTTNASTISSVRGSALGGAYLTASNDAMGATWNPAAGWHKNVYQTGWGYALDYNKLYHGIGDNIFNGQLSVIRDYEYWGTGIILYSFNSDIYTKNMVGIPIMGRYRKLTFAVTPKMYFDKFTDDVYYGPLDETGNDVLNNDDISSSFALDAGLLFDVGENFRLGFTAQDIVAPKLGYKNPVNEPSHLRLGGRVFVNKIHTAFSSEFGYELDAPDESELNWSIGAENIYFNNVTILVGACEKDVSFGLQVEIPGLSGLNLDMAYSKNYSDINEITNTYRAGIHGNIFSTKEEANKDLTISASINKEHYSKDEEIYLTINTICSGRKIEDKYTIEISIDGEVVNSFKVTEPINIEITIPPQSVGKHQIKATIDSKDKIRELNENNNSQIINFEVLKGIDVGIRIKNPDFNQTKICNIYQDETVAPIVFFDKNDSMISPEFDELLELLKERIKNNPDINIIVKGYGFEDEDLSIPRERAINVRDKLIENENLEVKTRLIIPDSWDYYKPGIFAIDYDPNKEYLVKEENQRVEFEVVYTGKTIDDNSSSSEIAEVLKKNPDLMLIVSSSNTQSDTVIMVNEAVIARDGIIHEIGAQYESQILASLNKDKNTDSKIFISTESILYKPRTVYTTNISDPNEESICEILIDTESDNISKWSIILSDIGDSSDSNVIFEGYDSPPKKITWNFTNNNIEIDSSFNMTLIVEDEYGQKSKSTAKGNINKRVVEKIITDEKLILVQFEFDMIEPQSRFLVDRFISVAEKIIEKTLISSKTSIVIEGHTDIIGTEMRNISLSQQRASAVKKQLITIMASLLNIESYEVPKWLEKNNATITSQGFAAMKPYSITKYINEKENIIILGNNNTPHGRTINRRVLVSIESID